MLLQNSPLWWLFAVMSAALWIAVMRTAMPTRAYKLAVSFDPFAVAVPTIGFSVKYGESPRYFIPIYCAMMLSGPLGILGHRKAIREILSDPNVEYGEASGPWTLQFGVVLAVLMGAAFYYVGHW